MGVCFLYLINLGMILNMLKKLQHLRDYHAHLCADKDICLPQNSYTAHVMASSTMGLQLGVLGCLQQNASTNLCSPFHMCSSLRSDCSTYTLDESWLFWLQEKPKYPQLQMLLFPNAHFCSLYERNCVCAVTTIITKFLPANNFCQLLWVRRKRSCTSAGKAQAQLHFRDDQQRAFGISNISNWSSMSD